LGLAILCAIVAALLPAAALAGSEPPVNDNFLASNNLNAPHTPLNAVATLQDITDTVGATLQQNILDPCGSANCPSGLAESHTCQGVSYGKTVWYDFYPDHDGQVEIRTNGIPNVIALYTYAPLSFAPTPVRCAPGSGFASNELSVQVRAGVDYTFQVGGRGGAGGSLRMLFNYAYQSRLTVAPFLMQARFSTVVGEPQTTRLTGLQFLGLADGEQVTARCQACQGATFGDQQTTGNLVKLASDLPIRVSRRTRVIIGASSPAQIGRFKIYTVNAARFRIGLSSSGCLTAGATSLSMPVATSSSDTVPCPVRFVNPIGAEYVFWRGPQGGLREKWYSGRWNGPNLVDTGRLGSAPAVAAHADGQQDVFWKGTNGNLWETWYTGQWHGPINLHAGRLGSGPAVGVDSAGDEYVFWQGTDGGLWERSYSGKSWGQPIPLADRKLGSAPAVAVHSNGEQDVFWKGANGNLWESWFTNRWNGPVDLGGGQLGSAPSVAVDGAGDEYVFWKGTDGGLWEKGYVAGSWGAATSVRAGLLGSAPTVAVHANGEQDVFWKGTNGDLWESWHARTWHGPIDLRGQKLASAPSAGVDAAGKQGTRPH
jgi:hypothetical protein